MDENTLGTCDLISTKGMPHKQAPSCENWRPLPPASNLIASSPEVESELIPSVPESTNDWSDELWEVMKRAEKGMTYEYADGARYSKYMHQLVRLQLQLEAALAKARGGATHG